MKRLMAILTAVGLMAAIASAQTLQVSVDKLSQSGSIRGGATAQAFTVLNSGTGTSWYTVADDVDWMSVAPATGSSTNEGDTITVTYVTTNLSIGKYDGTITVTQTNAPITIKTVAVTLTISGEISEGIVLGPAFALEPDSIAIADRGTTLAAARASGAVQIGPGVNSSADTFQFRSYPVIDSSGQFVAARYAAITAALVPQIDTNETTDATEYTPRRIGDALIGGAGSGTNAVWFSKAVTTNDWIQLVP